MQKENTTETENEEEKSDEQIIEEIVKLTSEIYDLDYAKWVPIAQWLERTTHNRLVLGSSPSGRTNNVLD